jgi:hypothetical protein
MVSTISLKVVRNLVDLEQLAPRKIIVSSPMMDLTPTMPNLHSTQATTCLAQEWLNLIMVSIMLLVAFKDSKMQGISSTNLAWETQKSPSKTLFAKT